MKPSILHNCQVYTMDDRNPEGQAVAFAGGKILAVGPHEEVKAAVGIGAKGIDLNGATVFPGFHDCHVHLMQHGLELRELRLGQSNDLESVLEAVVEKARQIPRGEWIRGNGLPLPLWKDRGLTAKVLDEIVPDQPVLLLSQDHHAAWVNTIALKMAGIDEHASNPSGGIFHRDKKGRLSGLLLEKAISVVTRVIPEPTQKQLHQIAHEAAQDLANHGITTAHHMAYEPSSYWRGIASAASDADFPVRVWACIPQQEIEAASAIGLATGQGSEQFSIGGAKFFADGALGPETAWMLEPYTGTKTKGMAVDTPAKLAQRFPLALEAGLIPVTHAIGDAANRAVLDVISNLSPLLSNFKIPPRIEHAQHVHEADILRFSDLEVTASIQPIHLALDVKTVKAKLTDRVHRAYPIRSLLSAGGLIIFGSDTPIASPDLLAGFTAAVFRRGLRGEILGSTEAILPLEAARAYTVDAARSIGWDHCSGMIRAGFHADFTIFDRNPLKLDPATEIYGTIKSGRWTSKRTTV